ncbi:MAG: NAD(P)-binding protein [Candidatus Hodarchaeales archaeon]
MSREIAIIGGNVAGLSAAYHLSKKKYKVSVYESRIWNKPCGGAISLEFDNYLRDELNVELEETNFENIPRLRVGLWNGRYIEDEEVFTITTRLDLQEKLIKRIQEEPNVEFIEKRVSINDIEFFTPQTIVATGYSGFTKLIMDRDWKSGFRALTLRFDGYVNCSHPNANLIVLDNQVMGYGWVFIGKNGHVNIGVGADTSREILWKRYYDFIDLVKDKFGYIIDPHQVRPRSWVLPIPAVKLKTPVSKMRDGIEFIGVGDALGLAHPLTGAGIEPAWQSSWILAESVDSSGIDPEKYRQLLRKNLSLTSGRRLDQFMAILIPKRFIPFKDALGYVGLKVFRKRVLGYMRKYPWFALVHDGNNHTGFTFSSPK